MSTLKTLLNSAVITRDRDGIIKSKDRLNLNYQLHFNSNYTLHFTASDLTDAGLKTAKNLFFKIVPLIKSDDSSITLSEDSLKILREKLSEVDAPKQKALAKKSDTVGIKTLEVAAKPQDPINRMYKAYSIFKEADKSYVIAEINKAVKELKKIHLSFEWNEKEYCREIHQKFISPLLDKKERLLKYKNAFKKSLSSIFNATKRADINSIKAGIESLRNLESKIFYGGYSEETAVQRINISLLDTCRSKLQEELALLEKVQQGLDNLSNN